MIIINLHCLHYLLTYVFIQYILKAKYHAMYCEYNNKQIRKELSHNRVSLINSQFFNL